MVEIPFKTILKEATSNFGFGRPKYVSLRIGLDHKLGVHCDSSFYTP